MASQAAILLRQISKKRQENRRTPKAADTTWSQIELSSQTHSFKQDQPRRAQAAWDGQSSEYPGSIAESVCGVSSVADSRGGASVQHRMRAHKAHKKWMRKHKIRDLLDSPSGAPIAQNGGMDALLWIGLVILMAGTVTSFVGLGEKGFKSPELRLVGPILSGFGLAMCVIRLVFCCCGQSPKQVKTAKDVASIHTELVNTVRLQQVISVQGARPKTQHESQEPLKQHPVINVEPNIEMATKSNSSRSTSPVGSSGTNSQQTITAVIETPRDAHSQQSADLKPTTSGPELLLTPNQLHSK